MDQGPLGKHGMVWHTSANERRERREKQLYRDKIRESKNLFGYLWGTGRDYYISPDEVENIRRSNPGTAPDYGKDVMRSLSQHNPQPSLPQPRNQRG